MSVQAGTNIKKNYLPVFEEYPEVTGFFSLKDGAVEGSPYNNPEMFRQLGLEDAVRVWPTQVHETRVAVIRQEDVDAAKANFDPGNQNPDDYSPAIIIPDTDGTITNRKNVLLTTVHADCLAVFCYDPVKEAIGLCHAGWRGTCAGIAMEMVEKMEEEYGCDPEDLQVYIGPGISQCCFEAGMEVAEAFAENWTFAEDYITRTPEDVANGKCHRHQRNQSGTAGADGDLDGSDPGERTLHLLRAATVLLVSQRRRHVYAYGRRPLHEGRVENFRFVRLGSMS